MRRGLFCRAVLLTLATTKSVWSQDASKCTTDEDVDLGFSDIERGHDTFKSDLSLRGYNRILAKAEKGSAAACATGIALHELWQFERAKQLLKACASPSQNDGSTNESAKCHAWLVAQAASILDNIDTERAKRLSVEFSSPLPAIAELTVEARDVTEDGHSLKGTKLTVYDFSPRPVKRLNVDLLPGEWFADGDVILDGKNYDLHCELDVRSAVEVEMVTGGQLTKGGEACKLLLKDSVHTEHEPPGAVTITASKVDPRPEPIRIPSWTISAQAGIEISPGVWGARQGASFPLVAEGLREWERLAIGVHVSGREVPGPHVTGEKAGFFFGSILYWRPASVWRFGPYADVTVWFADQAYYGFRPGIKSTQRISTLSKLFEFGVWETLGIEVYPNPGQYAPHYVFGGAGVSVTIGG